MNFFSLLKRYLKWRYLIIAACGFLAIIVAASLAVAVLTHENPVPAKLAREALNTKNHIINDVTEINPIKVPDIIVPHTIEEIQSAVREHQHISIGGGRFSMGGQTASARAAQIDMRQYNKVISFSPEKKEITVQSGIRWRDIQDYIDPYNLSVKIMQTYSNFTVGGSLSVNVHGRYMGLGPVILSVKKIRLVLADGSIVDASPIENKDIFYSAIGGMGGIGAICEVTLSLADNVNVERSRVLLPTAQYWSFFQKNVRLNNKIIFHNGDLYPPNFEYVSAVSWSITDKPPTTKDRLIPRKNDYWLGRFAWVVMSEWYGGRWIRQHLIDPLIYMRDSPVHTRNYEASYDVAELEPENRDQNTYVLEEYFVPVEHFNEWVPKMKKVFIDHHVNVLNVSIRHAFVDPGAKLAWAKKESFAFVVYYKQNTDDASRKEVGAWTRKMIDTVLSVGGTYYLPYQLHATDEQFYQAYPGASEYFNIKQKIDPTDKFTNKLWDKYYDPKKIAYYKKRHADLSVVAKIKDYHRPLDNAYLSLPEWYIVYAADEYARVLETGLPSDFNYAKANQTYWAQYDHVLQFAENNDRNKDDYITVLKVIGCSFSAENIIKVLYENTIGRLSESIAGNTQVAEDKYAAKVAKDYAAFIYDYPWYDFPYYTYLKGLWSIKNTGHYTFGQNIRRAERKIILSVEYGIKTLYSKAIAYATHSKFGIQDDIIYAIVTRDGGKTTELISAPHYQPFTRKLIQTMEKERSNTKFSIIDIAGNDKITFSYTDQTAARPVGTTREIERDTEVEAINDGHTSYRDRLTVEANVKDIFTLYKQLNKRNISIAHFYDY